MQNDDNPFAGDKKTKKVYDSLRDGKIVDKVDMKTRPNLINLNHQHDFQPDGVEDTDTYYSVKCTKCPIGLLINKQ